MVKNIICKVALFLIIASAAGYSHAGMDFGLCPAVQQALDPNGDGYFTDGDNDKALVEAEACLASGSKRAYNSRAYVQRRLDKLDLAMADINMALSYGGDIYGAQRTKCVMATVAQKYDEAKIACSAAIAANPKKAGGYFSQAGLYKVLKDYPAALASIETAANLTTDDAAIWTLKSLILLDMNRDSEAYTAITQALRIAPTEFEPKSTAGTVLMRLDRNSEGLTMLNSAIDIAKFDDDRAVGYWKRGRAYEKLGNKDAAFADYDKSATLSPTWAQPFWERGTLYADRKNYAAAIVDFNKAIELFPNFADAYLYRGIAHNAKGSPRTALPDLKRAIQLNPKSAEAYFHLGVVNDALGNASVVDDYTRAIELDPKMVNAWNNRGFKYYNQDKKAEALADYNRALALDNTLQPALFWRARTYVDLGRDDDAIVDYTRLLQVNPGYLWAYYNRGELLLKKGRERLAKMGGRSEIKDENMVAAFRDYEELVERDKNHDMGTIWTNWALSGVEATRNQAEMLAKLERFWNQSPERSDKYLARSGLRYGLGRNQEALADARRALELNPDSADAKEMVATLSSSISKPQLPVPRAESKPVQPSQKSISASKDNTAAATKRTQAPAQASSYEALTDSWVVEENEEYGMAALIENQGQQFIYMCGFDDYDCIFTLEYNRMCNGRDRMTVLANTPDGRSAAVDASCLVNEREDQTYIKIKDSSGFRALLGKHQSISFTVIEKNNERYTTPKFSLRGAQEAINEARNGVGL